METQILTFTGRATPDQKLTYACIPFEVPDIPAGIARIDVSYRYSDRVGSDPWLTDGNTVDLGLVDERGADFGAMGFRGWSGSNKDAIFVAEDEATPSYVPGKILPGTWCVLLGFYKIAPQGCAYEVTVKLTPKPHPKSLSVNREGLESIADTTTLAPSAYGAKLEFDYDAPPLSVSIYEEGFESTADLTSLPLPVYGEGVGGWGKQPFLALADQPFHAETRADGWYRGELHCHTVHSDGDSTVMEVIAEAQRLGLDFLAITDHNDVSHMKAMYAVQHDQQPRLTLIPGCEMTTYYGHWNAWGLTDWVEFRIEHAEDMRTAMREAQERGALVSANHPRDYGPEWAFPEVIDYHCIEIWNGPWALKNWQCRAFYDAALRAQPGRRIPLVGGSDMHQLKGPQREIVRLATPTNWVYCPDAPTAPNILAAVRAGHSFLSEAPDGPRVFLTANDTMMGDIMPRTAECHVQVRVEGADGAKLVLIGAAGERLAKPIVGDTFDLDMTLDCSQEWYLRAEVQAPEPDVEGYPMIRALTNPVYFL